MQPANDAHRPPLHGFAAYFLLLQPRALPLRQKDRRTDTAPF